MRLSRSSGHLSGSSSGRRFGTRMSWRRRLSVTFLASGVILSKGKRFGTHVKGVKSGAVVKQSDMDVALASNWFIGGNPRINSIVRTRHTWLYWVLMVRLRQVYGLAT